MSKAHAIPIRWFLGVRAQCVAKRLEALVAPVRELVGFEAQRRRHVGRQEQER
jgi:hypothetical protein